MRLGDLVGATVVDRSGRSLGRVRDVRLVADGPPLGLFGPALRVDGLIVGRGDPADRLGYERRGMRSPALVAWAVRLLSRESRYVPWGEVDEVHAGRIVLRAAADDLEAP